MYETYKCNISVVCGCLEATGLSCLHEHDQRNPSVASTWSDCWEQLDFETTPYSDAAVNQSVWFVFFCLCFCHARASPSLSRPHQSLAEPSHTSTCEQKAKLCRVCLKAAPQRGFPMMPCENLIRPHTHWLESLYLELIPKPSCFFGGMESGRTVMWGRWHQF